MFPVHSQNALYSSRVNVFSTEVQIEHAILTSPTGVGTANLCADPNDAKVYPFAGQRQYFVHFSFFSRPWILVPSLLGHRSLTAREEGEERERETSTGLRSVFYHACTGVSLTTNNLLVTCDTTYRTGLRDNNCGLKHFQCAVSTGHPRSTENKTGFENQSVSATNEVGGNMDEHVEAGRGLSLSCYFSFVVRELN